MIGTEIRAIAGILFVIVLGLLVGAVARKGVMVTFIRAHTNGGGRSDRSPSSSYRRTTRETLDARLHNCTGICWHAARACCRRNHRGSQSERFR